MKMTKRQQLKTKYSMNGKVTSLLSFKYHFWHNKKIHFFFYNSRFYKPILPETSRILFFSFMTVIGEICEKINDLYTIVLKLVFFFFYFKIYKKWQEFYFLIFQTYCIDIQCIWNYKYTPITKCLIKKHI